jgi:hypothetical protein
MRLKLPFLLSVLAPVFFGFGAWAQTKNQNTYVSPLDQSLTVRTVLIAPIEDNLEGIYAKPVEQHLKDILSQDPQWSPSDFQSFSGYKLQTLYTNPAEVMKLAKAAQADAILKTRMSKGPQGISSKMTLFSGYDGLPIVEENMEGLKKFEINEVKDSFARMLSNLRLRMPYRAEILSRRGQEITLNAGKGAGIKPGSDVSIIQILKVNRHPKLKFVVSSEKEILGKARVFKVDDTLTFAHIIMEREPGVVQVGAKVLPDEYIRYSEPYVTDDGQILTDLNNRKEQDVAYGEKPEEWLPEAGAQYGKVDVLGGITQYTQTASFVNSGSIEGTNNFAPTLSVAGEFWISPQWFAGVNLRSSAFNVNNQLNGSKPEKINMTLNSYTVQFGYNFLLSPDFFGPKLQLSGGIAKFSSHADETSPIVFTNMDFGGMVFSFAGQFPVGDNIPTDLGARFNYYFNPSVSETRSSGSSSDVKINDFGFFFNYHARPKFSYLGELKFEYYSAGFSGGGDRPEEVTSISHKVTTLLFGLEFLF